MATSGTASFNPDLMEIIEEAYERIGVEYKTGYDFTTARRSLNLITMDWANQGLNMWTFESMSLSLVQGQYMYNLPTDTVDVIEMTIRTNAGNATTQNDLIIPRISVDTYSSLPNKLEQGRPIQYYIQRTAMPVLYFWPVPNGQTPYTAYYWRMRRIQDAGNATNTMDVPFRFVPALISRLAFELAGKRRDSMALVPALKVRSDEDWRKAISEDRERATLMIQPMVRMR